MNVGQRVLVIASWQEDCCDPPPIGSVGEIIEPKDADGDYYVRFPEWPCWDRTCDWFTPYWAIVPIDDADPVKTEADSLVTS